MKNSYWTYIKLLIIKMAIDFYRLPRSAVLTLDTKLFKILLKAALRNPNKL